MTSENAMHAISKVYHAYFTGLLLTITSRKSAEAAGKFSYSFFRRQHLEKFLPGLSKLGISGLPDAVACARYHCLSNQIGGVGVEYMEESDKKAWIRFTHPRWVYEGAAICGVPHDVSRGFIEGWYAHNAVSLKNPRLQFVCTSEDVTGEYGFSGYFMEHESDLPPGQGLVYDRGQTPPPYDDAKAPKLDRAAWPTERLTKARRNYSADYVRNGLMTLNELFGNLETVYLGGVTGALIGRQYYQETAELLGLPLHQNGAIGFAEYLKGMLGAMGDEITISGDQERAEIELSENRILKHVNGADTGINEAWLAIWKGTMSSHDRFLTMETRGDGANTPLTLTVYR